MFIKIQTFVVWKIVLDNILQKCNQIVNQISLLLRGGDLHFYPYQPVQMGQIYI